MVNTESTKQLSKLCLKLPSIHEKLRALDTTQIKLNHIHKEIIELKQENRNIGDKIRSFHKHLKHNSTYLKCLAIVSFEEDSYVYKDRVKRDNKTIEYLEKLQKLNSKLINKHRTKQRELRSELQELKISLDNLNWYIS